MRQRISLIALLLCLLMLMSLLPAAAFADDEIEIVDELADDTLISEAELDGELVELPGGPEAWRWPEEELRPFTGEYGWLQLDQIGQKYTMFCAGGVIVAIPVTILFMCLQKYYVEGVTGGAVKG